MIYSVWIVKDGILLFGLDTGHIKTNKDLLSGFFTALSSFAMEVIKTDINSITLGGLKFVFEKCGDIYFIIGAERDDNDYLLHKKIVRLQLHFLEKYGNIPSNWDGNTDRFSGFKKKAEDIITKSMEGTKVYCESCERAIPGKYITQQVGPHEFYFCCVNCAGYFSKLYNKHLAEHACGY